jgi:nitrate/nitrite-specific signal transduction histidine kinase
VGKTGYAYIVDASNRVLAHPDPEVTSELKDLSQYPPVVFLRQGGQGFYEFRDENGINWQSYVNQLESGWGVIVQQEMGELKAPLAPVQRMIVSLLIIGLASLFGLSVVAIQHSLRPLRQLTEAATAIASGDLSRDVISTRRDETGVLANAFNRMTSQVRSMVGTLEKQVAERTRDLEASFQISQRLVSIIDRHELTISVVEEVKKYFNFYHVHVYLFDESGKFLMMVGGTGEVGDQLLKSGHRLMKGQGLVGRAAERNTVVLVNNTVEDPGWLPNPLLPDTKSEVAVPIAIGANVLGVLDVQQAEVNGISEQNVNLLQAIANQTAVAFQHAKLLDMAQRQARGETRANIIAQKIQSAATIEAVLQTALRELTEETGASLSRIQVGFGVKDESSQKAG